MKIIIKEFPTHIARTNNKVAANKMIKINNQSIYNSNLNRFARNIVMDNLHNYLSKLFKPYLSIYKREPPAFPLKITVNFYTVINHGSISMRSGKLCWKYPKKNYIPNWDIENLATIWIKAICDTLVKCKFFPDDNVKYLSSISYNYYEIEKLEDRKIEIEIS